MIRSAILACLLISSNAAAHWVLDNDASRLSFVTVKAGNVGEVHRFNAISGEIGDDGRLAVEIQLASVDTLIPIRDERMQTMLFETNLFPVATFSATLNMADMSALAVGSSTVLDVTGELALKDMTLSISPRVMVTRFASRSVLVTTLEPMILNADAVGLAEGVEKLREVAGLPSISSAVPVTFVLTFRG